MLIYFGLLFAAALAREIVVEPGAAIAPAIEKASPGDVIRLRPGIYREYVTIRKPVTLTGDKGAVIDPSEPLGAKWEPASEFGKGVYKATLARQPYTVFIDGHPLAQVNPERNETATDGTWYWRKLLASGTPRTGFEYIRGLWLFIRQERVLYLHLAGDEAPASHAWTAVFTRDAAITIRDTESAHVRDLAVRHGFSGVMITGSARNCSVTKSAIGPWDKYGVAVHRGAAATLVESNGIFRDSWESLTPISGSRDWYEIWQIHKIAGIYDRVGISLSLSGGGNRIHDNHVHDTFDGIDVGENEFESLDTPLPSTDYDRDAEIWDNVIERTGDSGMEIGGPAINVRIHHNVFRRTHGGLRFKLPRVGPVFIYRNVLFEGSPFNIWYSMDDSTAEGYVYHNTIVGSRIGLQYSSMNAFRPTGAANWHYVNNLFITERGFFETSAKKVEMRFTVDYNVVQGEGRPYPGDAARDIHSRYVKEVFMSPGFPPKPLSGSRAIDAGLDLSTYFHGRPLPGCEPGYFKGKAPDAGAYEVE